MQLALKAVGSPSKWSTISHNILIVNGMHIKIHLVIKEKLILYKLVNHQFSLNNERL